LKFQQVKVTFPITSYDFYDSTDPLLYLAVLDWYAKGSFTQYAYHIF